MGTRRAAAVYDPCCREKGISVVDMGLLRSVEVHDGQARVELLLTSGWCPFAAACSTDVEDAIRGPARRRLREVELVWDEAWTTDRLSDTARAQAALPSRPGGRRRPGAVRRAPTTPRRSTHDR